MKKSILNVGKALNKAEQKEINGGGRWFRCYCKGKYIGGAISDFMCGYMCASNAQ